MRTVLVRFLAITVFLTIGNAGSIAAQGRRGQLADSASAVNVLYPRLFGNIDMPSTQQDRAKAIIWKTQSEQLAVAPQVDGYDKIRALQATRDSLLASLMTSKTDSTKFEANAAKMRPPVVQRPPVMIRRQS